MPLSAWVPWVPALPLAAAAAWDLRTGEIPDVFAHLLVGWSVGARLVGWLPAGWVDPLLVKP